MNNSKSIVLTLCICVSIFNAFSQVPSYVPTNGLVGWWPFNGNANDESGNGNNGTVNGATLTTDRYGNVNKAYSFDGGNDFIQMPNYALSGSFTISIWYKMPTYNINSLGANDFVFFCNHSGINDNNRNVLVGYRNFGSEFGHSTYVSDNSNNLTGYYSFNQIPTANIWHHFICMFENGNYVKMYLDDLLFYNNNSVPNNNSLNSQPMFFGIGIPTQFNFFNGQLDDIAIYNRILTQQEISNLYNPNSCSNDLTISPSLNTQNIGGNASFTATTSDSNPSFTWQSDFGQGFQTLNNYGNYLGANTNTLTISNLQLANHNQPIRAISTSGNCIDTSNIATIQIADTCISNVTVYDTLLTTVTDTLIINTTLSLPAPNNENTILIYPNPASDHITIDNGNFAAMAGYSIKIENNAGQQVFQSVINQQQFYVDLSTWTGNGLYFVHLVDPQNNMVTVRKIVLQ